MRSKIILVIIVVLALLLRVIALSSHPVGFTQDEAGIGYDAYSILKTGKDQWGVRFPLVLRSFGDFKMPLYSYLAIPSIALFGLNEFSVRLPSAVLGTLAVLTTFLMVNEYSKRENLALWSSLLLAISPWHLSLSRGAFEANLTVFFMSLGVYAFLKGLRFKKWMLLAAGAFGLNLFSYHSARLVTPLVVLLLVFLNWNRLIGEPVDKKVVRFLNKYKWSILLLLLFLVVVLYSMFSGASTRGLDITILNPTDKWAAVADRRLEAINLGLPEPIARLYSNKPLYVIGKFTKNYISYLSPGFLFLEGVGDWGYGMIPGRGVLYLIEIVSVSLSLIAFVRKERFSGMTFFILWILVAPIPAALSKGSPNSGTRAAVMMPAIQIISAYGIVILHSLLKKTNKLKAFAKLYPPAVILILLVSLASFVENYVYHEPVQAAVAMQSGYKKMMDKISNVEGNYDSVVISRTLSVPNIWVQFYAQIDPKMVQRASQAWLYYEDEGVLYLDQKNEYRLGKYVFGDIKPFELSQQENTLAVGRLNEFPEGARTLDTFYYANGDRSFVMMDSKDLKSIFSKD
jgi:4-amino-4-deoxy-L-arabinose transferase-like glycosyltransferase